MSTRKICFGASGFLAAGLSFCAYIGLYTGNVRTVVEGQVYRSAQIAGPSIRSTLAGLLGHDLDRELQSHRIRSVINLQGPSPNSPWYQDEMAISKRAGVTHYDVALSDRVLPPPDRLKALFAILDTAAYPILIHCKAGADRSGLVAALYLGVYKGVPPQSAVDSQLTWRYGHMPIGRAVAMDRFFDLYFRTHGGLGLRAWTISRYPALYLANRDRPL
jgi:protein tyrosine/serine phosphatase